MRVAVLARRGACETTAACQRKGCIVWNSEPLPRLIVLSGRENE